MSHTPILVFCLGSRPLSPLGGGNVAALQHEGRVGSVRPARKVLSGRRGVPLRSSGQPPPVLEGLGSGRAGGVREGLDRPRDSLHLPQMCGGRREMTRGPRPARAEAAVAGVLGTRIGGSRRHGRRPSGDSRAPGGRPRAQGGDADRARHDPGEARGSPPAGSWSPDAWTPGSRQHTGRLFSGSPPRGSHLRDSSRSSRRTKRWGREAGPRRGERPGGPG